MDNGQIVQRTDALKSARSTIEGKWQEVDRYIMPLQQGDFATTIPTESSKDWSTLDVWDSTAPIGADRLAAMLHSTLLSGRWFGANFRAAKVNQDPKARNWLDDCVDRMFDALMVSNFPVEMASLILEWVGYGNGCLTQSLVSDTAWEGLDFSCHPVRELLFEEDHTGRPYRVFRPLAWTPVQILSKFRDKDDPSKPSKTIPESVLTRAAKPDGGGEKLSVIFCVYPREGVKQMTYGEKARDPMKRPWAWKYVLREGLVTLEEGGFYEMPTYVARWAKSATSQWGYGPSLLALPTVKLVNALQEHIVNAAAKVVDPATLVTERGLMSDLDLGPGGQTTVRSIEDIAPYESKARFDVSEMLLADHRNMIRKHFREDDITLKDSPAMTATEVNRRFVLLNRFLAPPVKRIQHDVFAPVIQNTFNAMYRMGQLEEAPDVVKQNPRMQIEFFGPLMTAQRDDEVAALERLLAAKAAMTKMDPGSVAKHVIKDDQALREMAERLATPASVLASQQEVDAAVKGEKQMQQAAAQAQIAKTAAEADRARAGAEEMGRGA
jgi:hypothetical protein